MTVTWQDVKTARDRRLDAQTKLRDLYSDVGPNWDGDATGEHRQTEARLDAEIDLRTERETELFDLWTTQEEARAGDNNAGGAGDAADVAARRQQGPTRNKRDNDLLRALMAGPSENLAKIRLDTTEARLVDGYREYRMAGGRPCARTFGRDVEHRQYVPAGIEERTLQAGVATGAAEAVPESLLPRIIMFMQDNATVLNQNAEVLTTQSGEDLRVPRFGAYSVATIVAENVAIGESDPTTAQAVLGAFKYAFLLKTTRELVEDEAVDLVPALARQGGVALARGAGAHFAAGTGTGQPNGANQGTIGVTAASATTVTGNELIDLQTSLSDGYDNTAWIMSKTSKGVVRKLVDGQGQYLWVPGLRAGEADTLLGRPVFTDAGMPEMATGNRAIIYGDLEGYLVRIVRGAEVARSDETDFANDRIVWRFILRADGDIVDTEAIRVLDMF